MIIKKPSKHQSVSLLVLVVVLGVIVYYVGATEIMDSLRSISPWWLLAFIVLHSTLFLFRAIRWFMILKPLNDDDFPLKTSSLFVILLRSWLLLEVLPARMGDIYRIYESKRRARISYPKGLTSIIVEKTFDLPTLLLLLIASFFLAFGLGKSNATGDIKNLFFFAALVSITLTISLLLFIVYREKILNMILIVISRFAKKYETKIHKGALAVDKSFEQFTSNTPSLVKTALLSFPVWFLDGTSIYIVSRALGYNISIIIAYVAAFVGILTFIFPVLPGSFGTYEGVVAIFLMAGDISFSTGVLIALIEHILRILFDAIVSLSTFLT